MSKRIAVGVGNTSVQLAQFSQPLSSEIPIPDWHLSLSAEVDLNSVSWPCDPPARADWSVASVNREAAARIQSWSQANWQPSSYRVLKRHEFPVELSLDVPEQVGHDRLAAATAVNRVRSPGQPAIFVDAGTAITINALDAKGRFVGGAILAGTLIASRALATWTDQLPEVSVDWRLEKEPPSAIGTSTESALASGIYWSAVGAVRELSQRISRQLGGNPSIHITGGFGEHLALHIDDAVYIPHLVVAGIAIAGCAN